MNDDRLDRLYDLLPAIYRMRDEERGGPLRALLRVIAEQVNVVEEDITRLYENWLIETCEDWVVPYLGDLSGYRLVHEAGEPGEVATAQARARNKILIPRRDVANTIGNRRRKGTLALLELLAHDVAGWPARAVEFYRLLGWTQPLRHLRLERGRTASLRDNDALALMDGPFDSFAHTVDVRRVISARTPGRYNQPSVGLFVWRLKPYTITRAPAYPIRESGPQCYTFSAIGHDTQLYVKPQPETDPTHIAEERDLPVAIRRWAFEAHKDDYYGEGKHIEIWAPGWSTYDPARPLPLEAIVPADLSDWSYRAPRHHVAVDPVLGRLVFPLRQLPEKGVRVSYVYAFSADIGGGEYNRPLSQPPEFTLVRVGRAEEVKKIGEAWTRIQAAWAQAPGQPQNGVIEIVDSGAYREQLIIELKEDQSLQIRAANRARPVLRLTDWESDPPDALSVTLAPGSRLVFDGLLISGRAVHIKGKDSEGVPEDAGGYRDVHPPAGSYAARGDQQQQPTPGTKGEGPAPCPPELIIRHCTLVPGWSLNCDCEPERPAEPSLELFSLRGRVRIEHSIVGSIQVNEDQVRADPIPILIGDSILDATSDEREALGAPGRPVAHAVLTILDCTVFGEVLTHAIELAENSIFTGCLSVARRQLGCMRFCYVPEGCRTPRRYHCQPDLAEQAISEKLKAAGADKTAIEAARARERDRVRPRFNSARYGRPAYAQLAERCAEEIKRGADDESEMGVFHDLFNPQREANLRARLDEYSPAGMNAGIIFVT